ncbi:MAG: trypsin-like peptidase domain-containing protein [Gemmataceae bacterium]
MPLFPFSVSKIGPVLILSASGLAGGALVQSFLGTARPVAASDLPPLPEVKENAESIVNRDRDRDVSPDRFEKVIARVAPTVVAVDAVKPVASPAFSSSKKTTEESGSGMLAKLPGVTGTFVITNNHVVSGARANEVTATMSDGRILRPSRLWSDPESDVAILKIDRDDLPTIELGDSDRCRQGQWVLAFGSPYGFNQTVTHGIISARDRGQVSLGNTIRIKEFLQTDAAINPGSSGGPLVDLNGAVVGINTAIVSNNGSNSGVSFSIPINLVKRVARQLLDVGYVTRGYLGVQLAATIEPMDALKMGLERVRGAKVDVVHPGSPAAKAGLLPGDVILKVGSVDIRDENHIINLISTLPANRSVKLEYWRNKQMKSTEAVVAEWKSAK